MKSKKGVIGIYWIVTAAIALLILLFMIYVIRVGVGGGITDMFRIQEDTITPIQKEVMKCQNLCNYAKVRNFHELDQWRASGYCNRAANIDLDGDGVINSSKGETLLHCWNTSSAYLFCEVELEDGTLVNHNNCT